MDQAAHREGDRVTVTVYLAWPALVLLLLVPYLIGAALVSGGAVGDGPRYTDRQNICGTVAVLCVVAASLCLGYAIAIIGGWA